MRRPKVKVLYAPGNNCHHELLAAFKLAGADPEICLLTSDLLKGSEKLWDCDIVAIPGGFSFGDHIAAGRIFAVDLNFQLRDQLQEVHEKQIPIIGICNGFQILAATGLLPGTSKIGEANALVDRNESAVFENRWVDIYIQESNCIWTRGLAGRSLHIPVAHGEGRLLLPDSYDEGQTVCTYGTADGRAAYPENPNGAPLGRAGICDPSGLIFGLMPHPERAIYPWLGSEDGIEIFKAGVEAVR